MPEEVISNQLEASSPPAVGQQPAVLPSITITILSPKNNAVVGGGTPIDLSGTVSGDGCWVGRDPNALNPRNPPPPPPDPVFFLGQDPAMHTQINASFQSSPPVPHAGAGNWSASGGHYRDLAPGGGTVQIWVRALGTHTPVNGRVGPTEVFQGLDHVDVVVITTPPDFAITSTIPAVSEEGDVRLTANDPSGAQLQVFGTAKAGDARLRIQSVTWLSDFGSATTTPDGTGNWNFAIQVPLGPHTITFICTDTGGNTQTKPLNVQAALPVDIFDTEPQGYLKALLEFATGPGIQLEGRPAARIRIDTRDATEDDFRQTFGQLFGDLSDPAYQSNSNEPVHKIRLVIEVLRKLLQVYPPHSADMLASVEQTYLQAAYTTLLTQIGTSYDEIRLVRGYDDAGRQAIADRLGIQVDQLQALLLDLNPPSKSSIVQASEPILEELFGLVDTARDPLSDGPVLGDDKSQIARWTLDGVEWNRNTDAEGFAYLTFKRSDGSLQANLYADAKETTLIASGKGTFDNSKPIIVKIVPENDSGIQPSSNIHVSYKADTQQPILLSAIPRFLGWQIFRLQSLWATEDFPPVLTEVSPSQGQPGQNGLSVTLIGQFTHFVQGNTAADFGEGIVVASLTVNSPNSATAVLNIAPAATNEMRDVTLTTGLEMGRVGNGFRVMATIAGEPGLTQLNPSNGQVGQQGLVVTITGQSTHFAQGKTTADFGAGITVASLVVNSPASVTAVVNIDPGAAEGARDVTLTTDSEVVTLASGFTVISARVVVSPLIDPDLLCPSDFKHPLPSDPAYAIYKSRQQGLQGWFDKLKPQPGSLSVPPQQHFDNILNSVLAKTSAELSDLDKQRSKGIDISWQLATMNLSVAAFNYLVRITAVLSSLAQGQDLLAQEWNDIYNILVQVQKLAAFDSWRTYEQQNGNLTLGPDWFQIASPTDTASPETSSWRGTLVARQTWLNSLQGRINQRQDLIQGLQAAVDATEVATLPILRDGVNSSGGLVGSLIVTVPIPGLQSTGIDGAQAPGAAAPFDRNWTITDDPSNAPSRPATIPTPNSAWLANTNSSRWIAPQADETQNIDPPGNYTYRTIFDLSGLDATSAKLSVSVAVDNQVNDVRLNGNSIGIPNPINGFAAFTPLTISNGFQNGLNSLDFVLQNDPPGNNPSGLRIELDSSAINVSPDGDKFTEWFLIDMNCSSYQNTTRLSQAIETLQNMFFALRTEKLRELPALESWHLIEDSADFDQEWTWMGSYANWVAATRVFLYPENLLLPILRDGSKIPPTNEFQKDIVSTLLETQPVSRQSALDAAAQYLKDIRSNNLSDLPSEINPHKMSADDLTNLKTEEESLFKEYSGDKQVYLKELFYFVPLYLASQLQQAGEFTAALDWYRLVYAYALPEAEQKIYYGLVTEEAIGTKYDQTPQWLLDSLNPHDIAASRANAYTRFTLLSLVRLILDFADTEYARASFESLPRARTLYLTALDLLDIPALLQLSPDPRIPANPVYGALRQHAEMNLFKLRTLRDIAGLVPVSDSVALLSTTSISSTITPSSATASTQAPTGYRYATLIDRAKQLVSLAQQIESSFLAALEKQDFEKYTDLKAQQDLQTAQGNVQLQNLQVQQANDNVTLASDQQKRSGIQVNHYNDLLNSDILTLEQASIDLQYVEIGLQTAVGVLWGLAGANVFGEVLSGGSLGFQGATSSLSSFAAAAGTSASVLTANASLEEKMKDWQFQLALAQQDQVIANQQYQIAQDQQAIAGQQQQIAKIQHDHAQATVDFLTTQKFTNAALYEWMSEILQRVYSYFLQQASAVARMAQNQLAFERQIQDPNFIQVDYWQPPSDTGSTQPTSTKGLTGSARLLEDITKLDQYAFQTDQRKLQLTKVISLAQLDPFGFQRFVETGVLRFATPINLFDRDFPGHIVRLIKRVRVSVIALIPPIQGIRATLSDAGISRVVIEDPSSGFQTTAVRREPQLIALTSPANSSGLFIDLADMQSGLLFPFEGLGADTVWEFTMPQAANPFDYTTIADVLLTIDYTALDSPDYRQQVVRQLGDSVSADRAYSFRQQFADAWFDLNNPDQSTTPMVVKFETKTQDFPPNIDSITIDQVVLYFVPKPGVAFELKATLKLDGADSNGNPVTVSGEEATSINKVISTRRGNAFNWKRMIGKQVVGNWQLALADDPAANPSGPQSARNLIKNGQITDILFVISYRGQLPAWPA
jgi:hypothetical protein